MCSQDNDDLPIPAIAFLCVLIGCIILLCVVYQLLKRDMCCKLEFLMEDAGKTTQKDGYQELQQEFYGDETDMPTTDDDYLGRTSSKDLSRRSSRRSSYDIASKSDNDLNLGDSASTYGYGYGQTASESELSPQSGRKGVSQYGEAIDILISGPEEQEPVSVAGKILLENQYAAAASKLSISIIRAAEIPSKARGGASTVQVRLVMLPHKRQRFKTKVRPSTNPVFNETFTFLHVDQTAIEQTALRIRLYGHERVSRDRLIGESVLQLNELDLTSPLCDEPVWKTLTPRGLTAEHAQQAIQEESQENAEAEQPAEK